MTDVRMNNSYDLERANKFNLIDFIPIGAVLRLNESDVRLVSKYTVILGGYATVDVAEFRQNGKRQHFSVEICNGTFELVKLLKFCYEQPFQSLSEEMKTFVINFHNTVTAANSDYNTDA